MTGISREVNGARMRPHRSGDTPTGVLRRAALILDAFDGADRLNLSQIVAATGLPQSSAHRLLEHLVTLQWIRRDHMDYRLGLRVIELGARAVQQNSLRRAALPSLRWLHQRTGCVVHLGVLDGAEKAGATHYECANEWNMRGGGLRSGDGATAYVTKWLRAFSRERLEHTESHIYSGWY